MSLTLMHYSGLALWAHCVVPRLFVSISLAVLVDLLGSSDLLGWVRYSLDLKVRHFPVVRQNLSTYPHWCKGHYPFLGMFQKEEMGWTVVWVDM